MARPWCDTHTPLFTFFVPQKEMALSRNQKPESTQWLPTTRLLTYLPERDWDDAKKRHCSAVHPALILHHPRVLHKPCKGSILGCLYKGWSIEWSSRGGECVPHPFRRACSFVIFRVQHSCTHLIECTYITFNQQNNFFNNSLVCVCVCFKACATGLFDMESVTSSHPLQSWSNCTMYDEEIDSWMSIQMEKDNDLVDLHMFLILYYHQN
jgi:hypothetical protein